MAAGRLHSAVDAFAMWVEDRRGRPAQPFRPAEGAPLDCFGPLPPLPELPPPGVGRFELPSPRPLRAGDRLSVRRAAARGARRGTLVLVPPWKIRSPRLVSGYVALFARQGWEVWLACPPHHLERAAGAASGEGFVTLDLPALRATFEQLVLELRLLAALAAPLGEVALVGLSLGALGAALAATGPERLDLAALVAPPDLGAVLRETPIGARYRRLAVAAGRPLPSPEALSAELSAFDPGRRRPGARRVFVAAGAYDAIAPPRGAAELARRWGAPLRVYPRGHLTLLFACGALRRDLAAAAAPGLAEAGPARGGAHPGAGWWSPGGG